MTPENQKLREALKAAENIIVSALAHQPEDGCACNTHLIRACKDADRVLCRGAGLPFNEEVFCSECGKKLEKLMIHKFAFNGDEYDDDFPIDFTSTLMEDGDIGICICTDTNWCGYDQTESDQVDCITCPHCGKYPFTSTHIEVEEPNNVLVSCWTKPHKSETSPKIEMKK